MASTCEQQSVCFHKNEVVAYNFRDVNGETTLRYDAITLSNVKRKVEVPQE